MDEVKYFQGVCEKRTKDDVEETRTVEFIINTESKDRVKDILNYDNWNLENYNANPIVGYQHNVYGDNMCNPPNPDDVIGTGKAYLGTTDKGVRALISTVKFEPASLNPTAEKIFRKVLAGTLKAASVGIMPTGKITREDTKNEKGELIDFTNKWAGQELLEWSIVNIPANAEAVRRSLKNHTMAGLNFVQTLLQDYGMKEIKSMTVQQILDLVEKKHFGAAAQMELELSRGPDPNFNKYMERLTKMQNGQAKS